MKVKKVFHRSLKYLKNLRSGKIVWLKNLQNAHVDVDTNRAWNVG